MSSKVKDWAMPFLCICLASFAVYFVSLDFYFLINSDDSAYIFRNPYLQEISLANTAAIFSNLHYGDYLPVNLLSYSWDFTWWGFKPFGYHLTQVILHSLNACLLYLILRLLSVPERACWMSVMIFVVHPVQVESVVWVSERKNLLSTLFILLSLWFYLRHAMSEGSRRFYFYSCLAAFVLALMSKSISVMLPCIFVLLDVLVLKRKVMVLEKAPFFLLSLLAGLATIASQGAVGGISEYMGGSFFVSLFYTFRTYWDYLVCLFFPFQLSPRYLFSGISLSGMQSVLSYLLFFAICFFVVRNYRSCPIRVFAIGWFLLWLLPVSNLVPINTLRQDRYLYLPSMAVIVVVSLWLESFGQNQRRKNLVSLIASGLVFCLGSLSFLHTFVYASDYSYWRRIANQYPQNASVQLQAGYHCKLIEDEECAEKHYRQALAINPQHSRAMNNLGALMTDRGKYEEARVLLNKAILVDPADSVIYSNLIVLAEKSGVGKEKIPGWKKKALLFNQMKREKDYLLGEFRFR